MVDVSGGFGVVGSRPASAIGSRPSSGYGRRHGYVTHSRESNVDESLFGSYHQTRLNEPVNFKAPWDEPKPKPPRNTFAPDPKEKNNTKDKKKKAPILSWSPSYTENSIYKRPERKSNMNNSSVNSSGYMWNSRDQSSFHHLKHTPTYVDESLFGPRLQDATFVAPWNERKKGEKKKQKPYLWDPPGTTPVNPNGVGLELSLTTKHYSNRNAKRPSTAIGLSGSRNKQNNPLPVWKP